MKKNLIEIYALAVCFVTVACFVVTLGLALWDIVEFTVPEFTIAQNKYEPYQSEEAYLNYISRQYPYTGKDAVPLPSGKKLTELRNENYKSVLSAEKRDALQGFVQKLFIMIVDAITFLIHWKIAGKARRENS